MRVLTLALLALLAAIGMAGPPPALADCADNHSAAVATNTGTDRAITAGTIGTAVTDPEGWLDLPAAVAINTPSITGSAKYGMNLAQVTGTANVDMGVKSGVMSSEKLGATTYTDWRIHAGADAGGI